MKTLMKVKFKNLLSKRIASMSLVMFIVLISGCHQEGPVYVDEYDVVYSNYDTETDFNAKVTFSMPDQIVKIDKDLVDGTGINYVKDILRLRSEFPSTLPQTFC
jgi:hypothetical protein